MPETGNTETFLLFSDVHFDPFADPSLVPVLAATDVSDWKGILSSSSRSAYAGYGSDSNYALFESSLDDMADRAGDVAVVIYPGDILSHDFPTDYAALTGDAGQAGLNAFALKTVQFFVQEVDSRFPEATVLVADGNCDTDSMLGSIGARPGDTYLTSTATVIAQAFLNDDAERAAFAAGWSMGGYYALEPDGPTGLKYIVLNDNLWINTYDDPGAGAMELAWFASELTDSARDFQKVWVVAHIPPGASASGVAETYAQTGEISYQGNMDDGFNSAFTSLELAYSSTIAATFTGHMHNDDFRLLTAGDGSDAAALVRVSPGISPVFDSNPGYQIYSYDTQTFALRDETTYVLDLASSTPAWNLEYDYAATYGQTLATPQEWQAAYAGILTNPVSQTAYLTYKNQDALAQSSITAANASIYLLAPGFVTPES
ncbi:MAG: phosphoesterase, partial [Acidobacteriota bacterium]